MTPDKLRAAIARAKDAGRSTVTLVVAMPWPKGFPRGQAVTRTAEGTAYRINVTAIERYMKKVGA